MDEDALSCLTKATVYGAYLGTTSLSPSPGLHAQDYARALWEEGETEAQIEPQEKNESKVTHG